MVKESDRQYIKSLVEKYGTECITNAILEYTYGTHTFDHKMHSGGQKAENRGAKGLLVAIPSFLLCTLISPPAAFILLLGAVTNRMCAKWHEQKRILSALNPMSWAEYIATGNYRNKDGTVDFSNKNNNTDSKNTEDTIRRSINDPNETPELKDVVDDVTKDNLSGMTLSEIETAIFRYWFITFDNGEVFKVKANNEENAVNYGKAVIRYPLTLKRFAFQLRSYEQYKNLMKEEYDVYRIIYSDGQVLYAVGKNEQEAKATGKEMVTTYAKAYTDTFKKSNVHVNTFAVPSVVRVEKQETLDIPFPKEITKVSNTASIPGANIEDRSDLYWETLGGHFWQYSILFNASKSIFKMNFPGPRDNDDNAKKLARALIVSIKQPDSTYKKMLVTANNDSTSKWYKASFLDGDLYYVYAEDKAEAEKIALSLYKVKISICGSILKGENANAFNKGIQANGHSLSLTEVKKEKYPEIPKNIYDINVKVPRHLTAEEKQMKYKGEKTEYIINAKLGDIN